MPAIVTQNDPTQGHCWFPTTIQDVNTLYNNVLINGTKRIVRFGDKYNDHVKGCTVPTPTTHSVVAGLVASPDVFVANVRVLRDGDPLSCGDVANSLGSTVFANGGGFGPLTTSPLPRYGPSSTTGYSIGLIEMSYPVVSANIYAKHSRVIVGQGNNQTITDSFLEWCGPLSIKPNWRVKIVQEETQTVYYNTINGTPNLPPLQPGVDELLRNPLPVKFNYIGNLPAGLNFNTSTGEVYGIPESLPFSINIKVNGYIFSIDDNNLRTQSPTELFISTKKVITIVNGSPTGVQCPNETY
ncbi:MAG: hypothetical protein RL348_389 [Bacteroidota bacterium]